jgi:hypothetical protein|nr:MAG TPA: hypothetical protein [Caudoviricetes sp.]
MKGYRYYTIIKFRIESEPEREETAPGQLNFGTSATYVKNHFAHGEPFMMISSHVYREEYVMDDDKFFSQSKLVKTELRRKYD